MGYGIYLLGEIHVTPPVTRVHQKQLIEQSSVWKFASSTVLKGYNRPGSENKGLFEEPLRKIIAAGKKLGYTFNGRMEWEGEIVHRYNQSEEECRLESTCQQNDDHGQL